MGSLLPGSYDSWVLSNVSSGVRGRKAKFQEELSSVSENKSQRPDREKVTAWLFNSVAE